MLAHLVLGNALAGGTLVMSAPLAFASLLSFRYPDQKARAMPRAEAVPAVPLVEVMHSDIENLAAHRQRRAVRAAVEDGSLAA
jgi:hypothetical protein